MSKKESKSKDFDISQFVSLEQVENAVSSHKDSLHRKVKLKCQVDQAKKDMASSYNEQLKEIQGEIEGEIEILDELEDRKRELGTEEFLGESERDETSDSEEGKHE